MLPLPKKILREGLKYRGCTLPSHGPVGEVLAVLVLDELHVRAREEDVDGAGDAEVVDLVGPRLSLPHLRAPQVGLGEHVAEGLAPGEHVEVDAAAEVDQLDRGAQLREEIISAGGVGEEVDWGPERKELYDVSMRPFTYLGCRLVVNFIPRVTVAKNVR